MTTLHKRLPAAWAVLAVALALLFVLFSAIGLLAWNSHADAIERARVRVVSSTLVVSTHIEWLVAAGLQTLDEADHLTGPGLPQPNAVAGQDIARHFAHMPEGISVALVDLAGKAVFTTDSATSDLLPDEGLDLAKLSGERTWYVSAITKESASEAAHFIIARRIDRDGVPVGAAVMRIPVSVLKSVWQSLDLGPGSTVGLLRDDGWLVARHPPATKPTNLSDYVLFTDYLKKDSAGIYDAVSPVDGEVRIVGYRKVPNAPLIITASVSRDFALLRLWDQMRQLVYFLVPLALGLGILALWVSRLLRRDETMRANLAEAVERNTLLMREIHHRTKNNLQSVASLIKLQPISEEAKAAMSSRIAAMSAVHEQAYRLDQFSDVDLREYLKSLIDSIRKSSDGSVTIETKLAPASIDRDLAQPLGLIVNEVISNAMKHAFKERETGRITVELSLFQPDRAELVIHDDGPGYEGEQSATGMGSRLIRAFAAQLGNDYSYASDNGTRFAIRFAAKALKEDA